MEKKCGGCSLVELHQRQWLAVIARYQHLLDDNRRPPKVALQFSGNGQLTVSANGESVV